MDGPDHRRAGQKLRQNSIDSPIANNLYIVHIILFRCSTSRIHRFIELDTALIRMAISYAASLANKLNIGTYNRHQTHAYIMKRATRNAPRLMVYIRNLTLVGAARENA